MISYDDIPLLLDTKEAEERILKHFGGWPQFWAAHPGPTSQAFAWMNRRNVPCPRPGTLVWPNGATRWAVGCFLASPSMLENLDLSECLTEGKTLRLKSGKDDNDVSFAKMRLLPPVPLTYYGDGSGESGKVQKALYLLVFVDQRFFWRFIDASDVCGAIESDDTTYPTKSWDEVLDNIESKLTTTIHRESVDSVYLRADPETLGQSAGDHPLDFVRTAAEIFDCVAFNVGCEVVYSFDDEVFFDAVDNTDVFDANLEKGFDRRFGYDADLANPETPLGLIPHSVRLIFRKVDPASGDNWGSYYSSTSETGGTGPSFAVPIACSAVATSESAGVDPTNQDDLDALAAQVASDWYERFRWSFDYIYNGICRFDPCSQIDEITFVYSGGMNDCCTRIRSRPWNSGFCALNHQVADAILPGRLHRAVLETALTPNGNATAHFVSNANVTFTVYDAGYVTDELPIGSAVWVDGEAGRKYAIAAACP